MGLFSSFTSKKAFLFCTKTGYGVGFPKNSMWIPKFNEYLMRYRENGDLERMQRFWFTGACEPRKRRRTSSKPLALAQVYWGVSSVPLRVGFH